MMDELRQTAANDLYRKALDKWGARLQADVAIEEMAELTKAIIKERREPTHGARMAIAEEIADVEIMLGQLKMAYGILIEVAAEKDVKLNRLARVLDEEA